MAMSQDMKMEVRVGRRTDHWAHIFMDCVDCDQSIGLWFNSNGFADKFGDSRAREIFVAAGWTVDLARCPVCAEKQRRARWDETLERSLVDHADAWKRLANL